MSKDRIELAQNCCHWEDGMNPETHTGIKYGIMRFDGYGKAYEPPRYSVSRVCGNKEIICYITSTCGWLCCQHS